MLQSILFDFDGTLVDFVEADVQSLKALHSAIEKGIPFQDFLDTSIDEINNFHSKVKQNKVDPLSLHKFRLGNTYRKFGLSWDDRNIDLYRRCLIGNTKPYSGVEDVLSQLKKDYKIGLITNAYDGREQRERIIKSKLDSYFDTIVIAGEIGLYKPDPSIFTYALKKLDIHNTGKAVFIGDSLYHDIRGAKSIGMKTIYLSKIRLKNEISDFTISDINELPDLIRQIR